VAEVCTVWLIVIVRVLWEDEESDLRERGM
jgi:hypothetical protein